MSTRPRLPAGAYLLACTTARRLLDGPDAGTITPSAPVSSARPISAGEWSHTRTIDASASAPTAVHQRLNGLERKRRMLRVQDQEVPASRAEHVRDARCAELDHKRAQQWLAAAQRVFECSPCLWPTRRAAAPMGSRDQRNRSHPVRAARASRPGVTRSTPESRGSAHSADRRCTTRHRAGSCPGGS